MTSIRKGPLLLGIAMSISFFVVLSLVVIPLFSKKNGLDYADDLFNKLAKGSSYFIPTLLQKNEENKGKPFRVTLVVEKDSDQIIRLCTAAGAQARPQGTALVLEGDLGKILERALVDADHTFRNDGAEVAGRYGLDAKAVMKTWWTILTKTERFFKKNLLIAQSEAVSEVVRKAIEPAYNFYGTEPQNVSDKGGVMAFLLVFYVVYTLWWGYAILFLFEGLGLSTKKAKLKQEVG